MNPRIILIVSGGIIQDVLTTQPVEIGLIDYDCERDPDGECIRQIPQRSGPPEPAYTSTCDAELIPERADMLFNLILSPNEPRTIGAAPLPHLSSSPR